MPRPRPDSMKSFFEPGSIAVAGVSTDPNKLGSIIFANMMENRRKGLLKARVYALNPSHDHIGDQPCYPSIGVLPETPELLIVTVPESTAVGLVRNAAKAGVKAAVIVTSGYAEVGREDVEEQMGRVAKKYGMRILGPNTIGLVDTWSGVDSLFLRPTKSLPDGSQVPSMLKPLKGEVVVITQSGHLGEVVSEELASRGVGIRALVGTGNQLDISVEDLVEFFAFDLRTKVIVMYIEGVRDGRRFIQVAAEAAKKKPIVVFKVGKTAAGARAALTHTASMVGDYEVYRAAFRQSGIIEAVNLQELVDYSIALLMLPRTSGRRLAIITNAGGVGAIAADEAAKVGLEVRPLGGQAAKTLRMKLRDAGFVPNAALGNPIDLTATAPTVVFVEVAESVLALQQCDLGLLLPTHQTPAIGYDVARQLGEVVLGSRKPVSACVIGSSELASKLQHEFMEIGIPSFPTPERAVKALAAAALYSTVRDKARRVPLRTGAARRFSRREGPLPPREVSRLLRSYGIEEPRSVTVHASGDLPKLRSFEFPVVCKLLSEELPHKTDVGGVVAGVVSLADAEIVLARFKRLARSRRITFDGMLVQKMVGKSVEMILGGMRDPTFGPVVVFGLGGTYTELTRDYSIAIAPVSPEEVRTMLAESRLGRVLAGYRGTAAANIDRLVGVVSRFSRIMVENPRVDEMEVNPLMVRGDEILSVDARVVLRRPGFRRQRY